MPSSAGSFVTFLIVCRKLRIPTSPPSSDSASNENPDMQTAIATSFFLGIIFSMFPYDYPILWSTKPTPTDYYTFLETHLKFMHASPPLIPRILHIVMFLGLAGLITKLYKPSESNMLFDGASLVLYMCGVIVYVANVVKGLRIVSSGEYGVPNAGDDEAEQVLGREDSLKVMAASNTILALVLVGVLVLQAGQWYAERKEQQDADALRKESEAKKEAPKVTRQGSSASSKKKQ
ncbi:hypothetical protein GX51_03772 [Blastomyces parvus]|uniref:ER membrane protein SH3 n=1 Tax=Blastomyces parvus TaxID=2060905 RepID=A0A2B7X4F1_9EURO|nr:hypothetical protein GX51_03772 [Blastomyces parvus]